MYWIVLSSLTGIFQIKRSLKISSVHKHFWFCQLAKATERWRRDGSESEFYWLQFLSISRFFSSLLTLLHWISPKRCNHRQFAGRLTVGLLPTANIVGANWSVAVYSYCMCKSLWACAHEQRRLISEGIKRVTYWILANRLGPYEERRDFFLEIGDYLRGSLNLNWVGAQTHKDPLWAC